MVFREKQDGHHVHVYIQASVLLSSARIIGITTVRKVDSVLKVLGQHYTKVVVPGKNTAHETVIAAVIDPVRAVISHARIKKEVTNLAREDINLVREDTNLVKAKMVVTSLVDINHVRDKADTSLVRVDINHVRDKADTSHVRVRVDTNRVRDRAVISNVLMASPMLHIRKVLINVRPIMIRMLSTA